MLMSGLGCSAKLVPGLLGRIGLRIAIHAADAMCLRKRGLVDASVIRKANLVGRDLCPWPRRHQPSADSHNQQLLDADGKNLDSAPGLEEEAESVIVPV